VLRSATLLAAVGTLLTQEVTGDAVDRVCRDVVELLAVDGVAVTVSVGPAGAGMRVLVGASDEVARRLELAELTVGVGPCTQATGSAAAVVVDDLPAEVDRWPGLGEQLLGIPIGSVVATGLRAGSTPIGSMDAYRGDRHTWTAAEVDDITAAARVLGLGFAAVRTPDPDRPDGDRVDGDPSGVGIELSGEQAGLAQATGMVMAALTLSAPDALSRLRGIAFVQGRLVTDAAADVVAGRLPAFLD